LIESLTEQLSRQRYDLGLADICSLARPLGITQTAQEVTDQVAQHRQLHPLKTEPTSYQRAADYYVGNVNVTQLQFVLNQSPLARATLDQLVRLENAFRADLPGELKNAEVYFFGMTPSVYDMRIVTEEDQRMIRLLVIGGVFVILVLLLRRPIVSLYLIASVVLSYLTTLGATFALFWALDPVGFSGLDWKVPIFLFVILVAVGEDYNIFLMTRVYEEQQNHGGIEGIKLSLIKTGGIITSCGLIMAGTFSALVIGSLADLKQLGFALAFGVLLDTFVVRPILVPTFLILLASGRLSLAKAFGNIAAQTEPSISRPTERFH
jgi:RND superfamily putative drug exporter